MHIGARIKERRLELKLNQQDLARRCGWIIDKRSARICMYESGLRTPKKKHIHELAKALGVSFNWLIFGQDHEPIHKGEEKKSIRTSFPSVPTRDIPFIELGNIKELKNRKKGDYMQAAVQTNQFWTEMGGDSMVSLSNGKESLYEGDSLLVDPDLLPQVGDIILFELQEGHFKIRRLERDGSEVILKPLNVQFESYKFDENVVVYGVVTRVQRTVLMPRQSPIKLVIAS